MIGCGQPLKGIPEKKEEEEKEEEDWWLMITTLGPVLLLHLWLPHECLEDTELLGSMGQCNGFFTAPFQLDGLILWSNISRAVRHCYCLWISGYLYCTNPAPASVSSHSIQLHSQKEENYHKYTNDQPSLMPITLPVSVLTPSHHSTTAAKQ